MLLGLLTCKEALQRLDDYVDRELSQEDIERVKRHLRICHACTRKFAAEENFVRQMRSKLDHLTVPAELMRQISQMLPRDEDEEQPNAS